MNNRQKMYETNGLIKKELIKQGFHQIFLFPHLRFQRDYNFEGQGFDGIAWKKDDKRIYLLQLKTNCKPPKVILERYKDINTKYYCVCLWANRIKSKVEFYY